jgi:hypothetical protein
LQALTQALQPTHRVESYSIPTALGGNCFGSRGPNGVASATGAAAAITAPAAAPCKNFLRLKLMLMTLASYCLLSWLELTDDSSLPSMPRKAIAPAPTANPAAPAIIATAAELTPWPFTGVYRWERGRRRIGFDLGERMERFGKADALLGTAEAGMTDAHRPVALTDIAETDSGTVGVGFRPFATDFVETEPLAVTEIAEFQGETAGIEVWTPLAVFVDQSAIGESRPVLRVQFRRFAEGQQIENGGQEIVGIGRATGNVDDRLAG